MSYKVFYSWQSDLQTKYNRNFIEECIKDAIKVLNNDIELNIVIDRDTKDKIGTPDIPNSIFEKIDAAKVFIADVSFINSNYLGKKTPNPNVLIELGYAAKKLGWENIVCIFNKEYGKIEDLPFDLKFRRPTTYSLSASNSHNKRKEKSDLIELLKISISGSINKYEKLDVIQMYIKRQVDKQLLNVCTHIYNLLNNYESRFIISEYQKIIDSDIEVLRHILFEKKIAGFALIKDWGEYYSKLTEVLHQPFTVSRANDNMISSFISIIDKLGILTNIYRHTNFIADNFSQDFDGYRIVKEPGYVSDRYVYLKEEDMLPVDSGTILKKYLPITNRYLKINNAIFDQFVEGISELLLAMKQWIKYTGGLEYEKLLIGKVTVTELEE